MADIYPNEMPSNSARCSSQNLYQPMASMAQNDHDNVLRIWQSKNTIIAVKKTHTVKNLLIGGISTRKVNYLSPTYEGKRHDKKIADEEHPTFPPNISLYKDTGFQGYDPDGITTFQPQKKPPGKALTPEQKEQNRLISSIRVVIAHSALRADSWNLNPCLRGRPVARLIRRCPV